MTKQDSINRFLTEQFLGKCWHTIHRPIDKRLPICDKCGVRLYLDTKDNLDLHTWEGFGVLWDKAQQFEDPQATAFWGLYADWNLERVERGIINPLTFPELLARFLGWKEDENAQN